MDTVAEPPLTHLSVLKFGFMHGSLSDFVAKAFASHANSDELTNARERNRETENGQCRNQQNMNEAFVIRSIAAHGNENKSNMAMNYN